MAAENTVTTRTMTAYRRDRLTMRLFVGVPSIVAVALAASFILTGLSDADSGAALGSPTVGSGSDAAFWMGTAMVAAAAAALVNWRVPRLRWVSTLAGAAAVGAALTLAV